MFVPDKRVAATWASVGTLLLAWSGFAYGANRGSESEYDESVKQAQVQQHFWRVVAGQESGSQGGVLNKLARDLNELPTEELSQFRGDSNRYGGISEELGYDPFNGADCSECGPLDPAVIDHVVAAKGCCLPQVLKSYEPEKPEQVGGAPWFLWGGWLLSLPGFQLFTGLRRKRRDEQRYSQYGQEMELIRSIDHALTTGNYVGPSDDLYRMRDQLREAIDTRIKYGEQEVKAMKIEELRREARETLEAFNEGNRALQR